MNLYHYYDKTIGPFKSLSDIDDDEANCILHNIAKCKPDTQCAKRTPDYMAKRRYYEDILRKEFQKKGGMIKRISPHYMVVEQSQWLNNWYENSSYIKIPIEEFDLKSISFTYGDSHPTFSERVQDGKEYRKKLYPYLTADRSVGKIQVSNQTHGGRSGWKEAVQNMKYWMLH